MAKDQTDLQEKGEKGEPGNRCVCNPCLAPNAEAKSLQVTDLGATQKTVTLMEKGGDSL